jgi:hypothetical protein
MALALMTNDKNVTRIIAERFPRISGASLVVPLSITPSIAKIITDREKTGPSNYLTLIKLEEYDCNERSLW